MAGPKWTADEVIRALRAWAAEHDGLPPRRRDWLRSGSSHPEGGVVYRLFGSWSLALIAAGFDAPTPGPPQRPGGWDEQSILYAIVAWTERFGEPPTIVDWNPALARLRGEGARADLFDAERPRWPFSSRVAHNFGTWNTALQAAAQRTTVVGLRRDAPRPARSDEGEHSEAWTRQEVLEAIRAHVARAGRPPTYDGWAERDPSGQRPTTRTVLRLFGRWSTALTAATDDRQIPDSAGRVRWSDAEILSHVRRYPTNPAYRAAYAEAPRGSMPNSRTVLLRFHKWNAAREAAGLPVAHPRADYRNRLTVQDVLLAVEDCAAEIGRPPRYHEYEAWARRTGAPSGSTVRHRLRFWRVAVNHLQSKSRE